MATRTRPPMPPTVMAWVADGDQGSVMECLLSLVWPWTAVLPSTDVVTRVGQRHEAARDVEPPQSRHCAEPARRYYMHHSLAGEVVNDLDIWYRRSCVEQAVKWFVSVRHQPRSQVSLG